MVAKSYMGTWSRTVKNMTTRSLTIGKESAHCRFEVVVTHSAKYKHEAFMPRAGNNAWRDHSLSRIVG